jgi:hypothetical protein
MVGKDVMHWWGCGNRKKVFSWWGILVKKVICVAPGHKKCRIFVFLSAAHFRFLFKGLLANKRDSRISKLISLKNK